LEISKKFKIIDTSLPVFTLSSLALPTACLLLVPLRERDVPEVSTAKVLCFKIAEDSQGSNNRRKQEGSQQKTTIKVINKPEMIIEEHTHKLIETTRNGRTQ
jgi:hypothetical protein